MRRDIESNEIPADKKHKGMADHVVLDDDGKGSTIASISEDIEFVDPISYLARRTIKTRILVYKQILKLKNPTCTDDAIAKAAVRQGEIDWKEHYNDLIKTEIPPALISLLKADSKKDQIKILKGLQLTPENLWVFIFKAFTDYGYTYSEYRTERLPKNIEKVSMPKLATLNRKTGKVKKVGGSSLTDGQIKQAIEQRKVVSAKFMDNANGWHCFFITYRSIGGEESWKNGQPHFHYISDKFGISREDAVNQFKSDSYPTTSVHIELLGYGNQPK